VNRRNRRLRTSLLLGAAVLVVGITLALDLTDALQRLESTTVNERFAIRGREKPPNDVVVVAIDDKTLDELDQQWPYRRSTHARVIRNLSKAGAKVIAYDVEFTQPQSTGNEARDVADDNALIEAVRSHPGTVMATTEVDPSKKKVGDKTHIFGGGEGLKYSRATPANGNYVLDGDGRIRHMAFKIDTLETLPIAAARAQLGGRLRTPSGDWAWVDYKGDTPSLHVLSFSDVYRNKFPASAVRGKVAVVGATHPSLHDQHATSTTGSGLMPGPEIQASAVVTALEGFPLKNAPGWLEVVMIVVMGTLAPLAALRLSIFPALALGLLALALFLVGAQLAFNDHGIVMRVVYPTLAAIGALLATALIHGVTVAFEREQARDAFARFVPEAVVDEVLRSADGIRLGGVQREGTVMFSDLRGFTSFAETLEPATVIGALNRYLTAMSEAILDHGGTLVAYMGDGIMAVFGAPLQQDDHADRALAAARDMLARLEGFNEWLREEGLHEGFKMGIGLNSGAVLSGHVGSERRLEYTALGDTTNTAARLEGMTKGTPYQLYVADSTRSALKQPADDLVEVGEFEVRGRTATVRLWSLREEPAPTGEAAPPEAVEAS
jgi:adenylate cyclase